MTKEIPNWKAFIKESLTQKEADQLLDWANNELREWVDFKYEVMRRIK